jgi:hypothetical protein
MGTYSFPLLDQWGNSPDADEVSGFANPNTGENDVPATASITHSWTAASNITDEESSYATLSSSGGSYIFPYLRASNFGLNVPSGATVVGIEVEVVWDVSDDEYSLDELRLAWGASAANLSTGDKGTGQLLDKGSGDTDLFGGDSDMWGEMAATLTPAVVNSSDFGVVLKPAKSDAGSSAMRVDCIRVRVFYSITEDGEVRTSQSEALVLYKDTAPVRVTQLYSEVLVSASAGGGSPAAGRQQTVVVSA